MSENPADNLRIGDADRNAALTALGEHLSAGRIDVDEYGDRSARVTAARTRGELLAGFTDLPQPHPVLDTGSTALAPAPETKPEPWFDRPSTQRIAAAAVPVAALIGFGLFMLTGLWWWWLLPAVIAAVGGKLWGEDWWEHRPRRDRRRSLED